MKQLLQWRDLPLSSAIILAAWGIAFIKHKRRGRQRHKQHGRAQDTGAGYRLLEPTEYTASNPPFLTKGLAEGPDDPPLPPPLQEFLVRSAAPP